MGRLHCIVSILLTQNFLNQSQRIWIVQKSWRFSHRCSLGFKDFVRLHNKRMIHPKDASWGKTWMWVRVQVPIRKEKKKTNGRFTFNLIFFILFSMELKCLFLMDNMLVFFFFVQNKYKRRCIPMYALPELREFLFLFFWHNAISRKLSRPALGCTKIKRILLSILESFCGTNLA